MLTILAQRDDVRERTKTPERVALLWDVCRIPDFRKLLSEHHAVLLAEIFVRLADAGPIDAPFMDERIRRLEGTGEISTT